MAVLLGIRLRFRDHASRSGSPSGWRFISRQRMRSGATFSAGRQKKTWEGGAGRAWWLWKWLCEEVLMDADGLLTIS